MSKINLRAAFAVAVDPQLSAQQVFANRVSEIDAFESSVRSLRDTLAGAEVSPVTDRAARRRNVLVYYGVGGIGKTTLSQELERRYLARATRKEPRAAVRFDFSELTTFDIESYLLRLRAALGHLKTRWPAFDLALKVYWDRAHPGDPLEEFLNSGSAVRRAARAVGLSQQISGTIAGVMGEAVLGGVTGITYSLSNAAFSRVKDHVATNRVLRQCELLPVLLDADADTETLSYLPYLLAWELDRVPMVRRSAAVFIDTYENLTTRGGREAERLLQRSAYLMPNVLFVVTGRHRLDWGDLSDASELDFTGVDCWPNLAATYTTGEPRQGGVNRS